jgi:thioredoxin 1
MELDRLLIVLLVGIGFGLFWLAWRYYKTHVIETIQPGNIIPGKPNLLYFTAPYCAACQYQQSPVIEAIAAQFGDSINVSRYDVSDQPEVAGRYKVLTLPTTIIVSEQGEIVHINRGVAGLQQLVTQLQVI